MYIKILLFLHVMGAIAGFGPTFALAVVGAKANGSGPDVGKAMLEVAHTIEKIFILPVALFLQPVTGVLLIFALGLQENMPMWLTAGIGFYLVATVLSLVVQRTSLNKMLAIADGKAGSPADLPALGKKMKITGQILTVLLLIIVFFMVAKPRL